VWLREELENIASDPEEIYEKIKEKTGIDITKYFTAQCEEVIAPNPEEWRNFIDSDLYPEGVEKPEIQEGDSVKMFWEQWPSTLSKDPEKLLVCYHFGIYMAKKVLGSTR
jgi:hypothetical protein